MDIYASFEEPLLNKIELDGIVLKNLPRLEGVVILNINSWSAGTKAWGDGNGLGPSRRVLVKFSKKLR